MRRGVVAEVAAEEVAVAVVVAVAVLTQAAEAAEAAAGKLRRATAGPMPVPTTFGVQA